MDLQIGMKLLSKVKARQCRAPTVIDYLILLFRTAIAFNKIHL